ncbi:MAG: hypothetical protein FWD17_14690 [Polyangiaceae bacterium]|nr:hypothetical protein [Polyangiaceae bacterium]
MGMFDSIFLFGADAARARCAAGHAVGGELQTKDFDCVMAHYYVFEGRLYRSGRYDEREERVPSLEGGNLVLTRREMLTAVDITVEAAAYTHCKECDPVMYESVHSECVDHRYVWCEWNLIFERGRLTRVEPVRVETRESLRERMLRDGVGVLPDDDRLAKKHLRQLREGR